MPKAPHVESEHSQGPANRQQRVRDVRGTLQICTLDWEASLKKSLEGIGAREAICLFGNFNLSDHDNGGFRKHHSREIIRRMNTNKIHMPCRRCATSSDSCAVRPPLTE